MIRQFVSGRGAGLLMLGGQEMFQGKRFAESTLGELAPVYVRSGTESPSGPFRLDLTREGMLQPWLRLRDNATEEKVRLRRMPKFASANRVGELKAGAYQFASATDSSGNERPAVAIHRFGSGKVGAITVTDFWRWSMRRDPEHADDAAQAWRQIGRWLVADVPRRGTVSTNVDADNPDKVRIRVNVLDEEYLPMDNANVSLSVRGPTGKPLDLEAKPVAQSAGLYEAAYFGDLPGEYTVSSRIEAPDGESIAAQETGWAKQIAGREFDQLGPNVTLLQKIAESSGGSLVEEDELDQFLGRMETSKVPVTETWVYPLWHRGWVIALAR